MTLLGTVSQKNKNMLQHSSIFSPRDLCLWHFRDGITLHLDEEQQWVEETAVLMCDVMAATPGAIGLV